MHQNTLTVAVLGASPNRERYSNKAVRMLSEYGHTVFPVHPALEQVEGITVFSSLAVIKENIHTVTVYMNPKRSLPLVNEIIACNARRIILNPGTESEELKNVLEKNGIQVLEACTLVLLRTNQFS